MGFGPKKPPAVPQKRRTRKDVVLAAIAREISITLQQLHADEDLLAIIGSWRDTLDDQEILTLLQDYNAGRPIINRPN
jgi:hypothetical protein